MSWICTKFISLCEHGFKTVLLKNKNGFWIVVSINEDGHGWGFGCYQFVYFMWPRVCPRLHCELPKKTETQSDNGLIYSAFLFY